jgi:hypothetical protein
MTFNEYLQTEHSIGYMGTDDDMPEDFERWLSTMDIDVLIQYADDHVNELMAEVKKTIDKNYQDIMKILK